MRRRLAALGLGVALVASGCSNDTSPKLGSISLVASLERFDACDDFLDYVRKAAADRVAAYGFGGWYGGPMPMMEGDIARETAAPSDNMGGAVPSTIAESKAAGADDASGGANAATNNQEADVDEADVVKIDGDRIVSVRGNELVVTELRGGVPVVTGRLTLEQLSADKLFLLGDRAYVMGSSTLPTENGPGRKAVGGDVAYGDVVYPGGGWMPRAAVAEISLSGNPKLVGTRVIDGQILDGRMVDGTLRLVLSSSGGTRLGFVFPADGTEEAIKRAEETNRQVIAESTAEDWLPAIGTGDDERPLLNCADTYHPAEFSGLNLLSVLTIADGLDSLTATGVLADSQVTYASTERLYVATTRWVGQDDPTGATQPADGEAVEHTDVHAFDIAGTKAARYLASGRVDGTLLNQYSMSDSDGRLRIATTVTTNRTAPTTEPELTCDEAGACASTTPAPDCPPDSDCIDVGEPAPAPKRFQPATDSRIVVLEVAGQELKAIGSVSGLGAGETIQSVRFVGDLAYVVTFRRTDPFYVIDLSNPTAPRKLGELKVPGFSSYLHPVGDELVLGVGSDATDEGRVTGAKVSLYDTTDPVAPKELATWTSRDVGFMVDGDAKAFHFDDDRGLVFLPYYGSCWEVCTEIVNQNGVMVLKVGRDGITEIGRIDHRDRTPGTPATESTTTTVPDVTTTTGVATSTTSPDTITTVPETTTVPATTVPETSIPATGIDGASAGSSTSSSGGGSEVEPGVVEPSPPVCGPAVDCIGPEPAPYEYLPTITRVFVVGDVVVTLSEAGIATHDVATLAHRGFAAF